MEQKYRMLEVGEWTQQGDEVWLPEHSWGEVITWPALVDHYCSGRYRRPITETADAARHDHEMKENLDTMTKSWYDQRAELADAKNQITDLTRRLEYALSDKVIAERSLMNLEHHVKTQHEASWARIRKVIPKNNNALCNSLADDILYHIRALEWNKINLKASLAAKVKFHQREIGDMTTKLMEANSEISDKDITIRRLKEKLNNVEPYLTTVTSAERIAQLEQLVLDHYGEAKRLSVENEKLCTARYQLNKIKQAFEILNQA